MASSRSAASKGVKPSRSKKRFTLAEANRTLPLVSRIVRDIVQAHDSATKLQSSLESPPQGQAAKDAAGATEGQLEQTLDRLQELVDELGQLGVEVKDYAVGVVDFVGRHEHRDVYLCWKLGEERVGYWHELDSNFKGRQPVSVLHETA